MKSSAGSPLSRGAPSLGYSLGNFSPKSRSAWTLSSVSNKIIVIIILNSKAVTYHHIQKTVRRAFSLLLFSRKMNIVSQWFIPYTIHISNIPNLYSASHYYS